jgi:hypothetical protein
MMHKKNLVVAIKVDGKVLRESNDRVELPFGSEYSLHLKNLDTVRQQVNIQIDGGEESGWIVLNPNESQNIERFVRGNLAEGSRFKFIERTAAVEKHRGIEAEDGIIRVEFKREKNIAPNLVWNGWSYSYPYVYVASSFDPCSSVSDMYKYSTAGGLRGMCGQSVSSGMRSSAGFKGQQVNSSNHQQMQNVNIQSADAGSTTMDWADTTTTCNAGLAVDALSYSLNRGQGVAISAPQNDVGITVDGSLSAQRFVTVSDFDCEASDVIVLHLIGHQGGAPVTTAKTVRIKLTCQTCGKKNRSLLKFCPDCGTGLQKAKAA